MTSINKTLNMNIVLKYKKNWGEKQKKICFKKQKRNI